MSDSYIYIIVALLPLAALMLVFQVNPYHALVIRAILGGVAALVYAVLGAADVALTEALVGTMLAITLYVVAVRSSLVMRLGILKDLEAERDSYLKELIANLRKMNLLNKSGCARRDFLCQRYSNSISERAQTSFQSWSVVLVQ